MKYMFTVRLCTMKTGSKYPIYDIKLYTLHCYASVYTIYYKSTVLLYRIMRIIISFFYFVINASQVFDKNKLHIQLKH